MLFLKSLTGDNISLRGPADLVELASHEARSDPDRRVSR